MQSICIQFIIHIHVHIKDVILFNVPIVYKQQANQGFQRY